MEVKEGYIAKKYGYGIGWRILDEEGKVDTRPNGVVELSEPQVLIFEMLREGAEKEELVKPVMEKFSMEEEKAKALVDGFVDYLCQHRFIEGVEPRRF